MKDGDTRGQEQLIKNLKERLHWYAYECKPEEFNEKEVRTIVELLRQLEPIEPQEYFNAEKGLERFWKYYEQRIEEDAALERRASERADRPAHGISASHEDMEAAEDMAVLNFRKAAASREAVHIAQGSLLEKNDGDKVNRSSGHDGTRKSRLAFFGRHKAVSGTVVAAVLILMFSISGTFGAYAEKNTGFFHWITKDESGVEFITSPTQGNDSLTIVDEAMTYDRIEQVPEEYVKYIWEPKAVPNDLPFECVSIISMQGWTRVECNYGDSDYIKIATKIFDDGILFHREMYDNYSYLYEKPYNDVSIEFFMKQSDDETEYAISFYYDNKQYMVQGNLQLDVLEKLAYDYVDDIIN